MTTAEFSKELLHLERAQALYDAQQHADYRFQCGQDIGWAQWHLGDVEQALETAAKAIKRAEQLSHPHSLVYAVCHARGFSPTLSTQIGQSPIIAQRWRGGQKTAYGEPDLSIDLILPPELPSRLSEVN